MHLITDGSDDSLFSEKRMNFSKSLTLEIKSKGGFVLEVQE